MLSGKVLFFLAFVVLAVGAGGWTAYQYVQIRKNFSFDLLEKLSNQDENLRRLENYCLRGKGRVCLDAVAAGVAWNSHFRIEDFNHLKRACRTGEPRACRFLNSLNDVQELSKNPWQAPSEGDLLAGSAGVWPRVLFLGRRVSYREWLEFSYQGLLLNENQQKIDLLCAYSSEFKKALVCASIGNISLNRGLRRVAYLIEQDEKIPTRDSHASSPLLRFWQGYDLLRADFNAAVRKIASTGDLHPEEKSLWNVLSGKEWDFILAFNISSVFSGIPSHEFLHGVYFESQDFRQMVADAAQKNILRTMPLKYFVQSIYKTKNEFVILNEMQAYALQSAPLFHDSDEWNSAVGAMGEALRHFFSKNPDFQNILAD